MGKSSFQNATKSSKFHVFYLSLCISRPFLNPALNQGSKISGGSRFPRRGGGTNPYGRGANLLCDQDFPENCIIMKRNLTEMGAHVPVAPGPANKDDEAVY